MLNSYKTLIFLGWNTMTEEIYDKLTAYVVQGGHLVMALPHLNTETDRAKDMRLFRDGNFSELFGVEILGKEETEMHGAWFQPAFTAADSPYPFSNSCDPRHSGLMTPARVRLTGAHVVAGSHRACTSLGDLAGAAAMPLLVEHRLGTGRAYLLTTWNWPGDPGLTGLMHDLLRAVFAGEQDGIRVNGSDAIRHAIYDAPDGPAWIYLLNTDLDNALPATLMVGDRQLAIAPIPATELRLVALRHDIALLPEDKRFDVKSWQRDGDRHAISVTSYAAQRIGICNLGETTQQVTLAGVDVTLEPGQTRPVRIRRSVETGKEDFFKPTFLHEPAIAEAGKISTPY